MKNKNARFLKQKRKQHSLHWKQLRLRMQQSWRLCREAQQISRQDCRLLLMRINRRLRESLNWNNKLLICKDSCSKHRNKFNRRMKAEQCWKVSLLNLRSDSMTLVRNWRRFKLRMLRRKRKNRKLKKRLLRESPLQLEAWKSCR